MQFDTTAGPIAARRRGKDAARDSGVTKLSGPQLAHGDDRPEREPSEASLPESEELFRATFERAVIGIAHFSPGGRWLRVNQRLCDLLGYDRYELAARTSQGLTNPDDSDEAMAYGARMLAGELDEYELDKRFIRKDGTPVWVHVTVALVRTPEGAPDYFISMVQDISERKRLEQDRAQLLEQERVARLEAEAMRLEAETTNDQLRALQALTDTALSSLALDDLLRELLGRVQAVMGVDHVAILLLEEDGQTFTARAIRGLGEEYVGWTQLAMGRAVASRIAATRAPLIVDALSAEDIDGAPPVLQEMLRSVVGVPLLLEDPVADLGAETAADTMGGHPLSRLVGVLAGGSATSRRFTAADVQLLQRAGDRVARAVDRACLYAAEQDARRQAEAALARAQASEAQASERAEQLHTILDAMAEGVALTDPGGRLLQMNRAYRELHAADRLPSFAATSPAERRTLLDVRDAATGASLPPERMPTARAARGGGHRARRRLSDAGAGWPRAGGELQRDAAARR